MVLGFKEIVAGKPTEFVGRILDGRKKHTMRLGERWRAGLRIHMATGVRTKHYKQFNKLRPDLWFCKGTQPFRLVAVGDDMGIIVQRHNSHLTLLLESDPDALRMAQNDGFDTAKQLFDWFRPGFIAQGRKEQKGQIVHWTDFRY